MKFGISVSASAGGFLPKGEQILHTRCLHALKGPSHEIEIEVEWLDILHNGEENL
jgi:hypothetical protein